MILFVKYVSHGYLDRITHPCFLNQKSVLYGAQEQTSSRDESLEKSVFYEARGREFLKELKRGLSVFFRCTPTAQRTLSQQRAVFIAVRTITLDDAHLITKINRPSQRGRRFRRFCLYVALLNTWVVLCATKTDGYTKLHPFPPPRPPNPNRNPNLNLSYSLCSGGRLSSPTVWFVYRLIPAALLLGVAVQLRKPIHSSTILLGISGVAEIPSNVARLSSVASYMQCCCFDAWLTTSLPLSHNIYFEISKLFIYFEYYVTPSGAASGIQRCCLASTLRIRVTGVARAARYSRVLQASPASLGIPSSGTGFLAWPAICIAAVSAVGLR